MERIDLYRDIAERTEGDIYIGVVGPVRTGKSTFIKKFMDLLVIPNIENEHHRERVVDELPQSGAGRSIMTTQPRFVPNEAVQIEIAEKAPLSVRMVDCVGYMVKGAVGHLEGEAPRMVRTPWFDYDIPFEDAAEIGTQKVINDHSTIGVVMTTDGSITDIPRSSYIEAEERVIGEIKAIGKPFIIILNSANPADEDTQKLRDAMSQKYDVPVLLLNIMTLQADDITSMLEAILFEFPMKMLRMEVPSWVQALDIDHWLVKELLAHTTSVLDSLARVRDYMAIPGAFTEAEHFGIPALKSISLGEGLVSMSVPTLDGLFYTILGEECGYPIVDDAHLISMLKGLVGAKKEYDRLADALKAVRETGYGLVAPAMDELTLEEPQIVRHGNRFGVKLKASAPSLHLMRVDIQTEVSPIVGTEKQSEELVKYLLSEFESDPAQIWSTNIFGKSLHELVREGLSNKLTRMPEDAQIKIQETLQKIINEGSGGLICILL